MKLKIGDPAPMFAATATDDSTVKLSDYLGTKLVLYFYPMDDTPGCTKQACSLRDHYQAIKDKGAAILGVSTQDVASHQLAGLRCGEELVEVGVVEAFEKLVGAKQVEVGHGSAI